MKGTKEVIDDGESYVYIDENGDSYVTIRICMNFRNHKHILKNSTSGIVSLLQIIVDLFILVASYYLCSVTISLSF